MRRHVRVSEDEDSNDSAIASTSTITTLGMSDADVEQTNNCVHGIAMAANNGTAINANYQQDNLEDSLHLQIIDVRSLAPEPSPPPKRTPRIPIAPPKLPWATEKKSKRAAFNKPFKPLTCKYCGLDFKSRNIYEQHVSGDGRCKPKPAKLPKASPESASTADLLHCSMCRLEFSTESALFRHCQKIHVGEKHRCIDCQSVFTIRKEMFREHASTLLRCSECDSCTFKPTAETLVNESAEYGHGRDGGSGDDESCYSYSSSLSLGPPVLTPMRPLPAAAASAQTATPPALKFRKISAQTQTPKTADADLDEEHQDSSEQIRNFICTVCCAYFGSKKRFASHMERHGKSSSDSAITAKAVIGAVTTPSPAKTSQRLETIEKISKADSSGLKIFALKL